LNGIINLKGHALSGRDGDAPAVGLTPSKLKLLASGPEVAAASKAERSKNIHEYLIHVFMATSLNDDL
jgi:hypothetical protein